MHFKIIQPEDLLLVDHDGNIDEKESGPYHFLNRAAFVIHSEIHKARPDVMCAAHSHSLYGKTFSTLGLPLEPISQDSCAFYDVRETATATLCFLPWDADVIIISGPCVVRTVQRCSLGPRRRNDDCKGSRF